MNADAATGKADELRDEVVACAERTLAAPHVRVEFRRDWRFAWPQKQVRRHRRGGLLRPVGKLAKTAGKAAGKAVWRPWRRAPDPSRLSAEGIVEPTARRYMIDFGPYAELYKDGTRWSGLSGRPISTLDPTSPGLQIDLLWLREVLRGTTEATREGEERLHGTPCRRVAARADLARASALASRGLPVPSVKQFEELNALPVTVWIDGRHVRRVRFQEGDDAWSTLTLDLLDFDVARNDLDWDRLPTFRSPEAAG